MKFNLPEGWTQENYSTSNDGRVVIGTPVGSFQGVVTIDFNYRRFRGGYSVTGPADSTKTYTGRKWRERLVADAVEYLRKGGDA